MKKYILSFLLLGTTMFASAQLVYKENAKTYLDAGVQFTYEGGFKVAFGTRLNDKLSVGLSLLKGTDSEMLNMGVDARVSLRKPNKRAGLLIHGGYFISIIQAYDNSSLVAPEFGIGAIMDNFSITAGVKYFSVNNRWGGYNMASPMLQTMYHFGSISPDVKKQNRKTRTYLSEADKVAKRKARLESPVYFDVALGFANRVSDIQEMYGGNSSVYYNVAVGWQKTKWMGFGLNYTNFGSPDYDGFKSLGVSWRARPRFGYFKATLNVLAEFEEHTYSYINNSNTDTHYKEQRLPPSLSLELGVRCWDMLLFKVGYLFQSPFDIEVTSTTYDFSGFGQTIIRDNRTERLRLGYFHMGVGFVL